MAESATVWLSDSRAITEGTSLLGKVAELDLELDAVSITRSFSLDKALDVAVDCGIFEETLLGKGGLVFDTNRVVVDSGSIVRVILAKNLPGKRREQDGHDSLSAHFE